MHQLQIKLQLHYLLKEHQISHLRLQTEHHQVLQAQTAEESLAQEVLKVMAVEEDNLSFYAQTINSSF